MAIQIIGTAALDWTARNVVVLPPVTLRRDRGYLFFLDQLATPVDTENQYVNVVARMNFGGVVRRSPLIAKLFPSSDNEWFSVGVPDGDFANDVDTEIILIPKEFIRGTASNPQMSFQVSYDDEDSRDIAIKIG